MTLSQDNSQSSDQVFLLFTHSANISEYLLCARDTEVTKRVKVLLLVEPAPLNQEVAALTCLLANREESWSMSMMMMKSSSTHFLISRPLTYKMKKRAAVRLESTALRNILTFSQVK